MFPKHKLNVRVNTSRLYIMATSPFATFSHSSFFQLRRGRIRKKKTRHSLLIAKRSSPELSSISFSDPEVVSLEQTVGEDGFQLSQHVAEDQRQLGEVPPGQQEEEHRTDGHQTLSKCHFNSRAL